MTGAIEHVFAAMTAIMVTLHLCEWLLCLYPRSHARRSSPRLLPVLQFEAAWYIVANMFSSWCPGGDDDGWLKTAVLLFGGVHILGLASLYTDTLRLRLEGAARAATSASSVSEIVQLFAHETGGRAHHWKTRARAAKTLRSTYIATFLFDLVETVVLGHVLWCSVSGIMLGERR